MFEVATCCYCYTCFWPNREDSCPKCGPCVFFLTKGPVVDSMVHYLDRVYELRAGSSSVRNVDAKTLFSVLTEKNQLWLSLGPTI